MEKGDLNKLGSSLGRDYSLIISSSNTLENFSTSLHDDDDDDDDDDEEALKWASIERLPTYDRLKKGLLLGSRGLTSEIDIKSLDFHERYKTVERLVKNTEEENEKFLLKLRNRIDRQVPNFFSFSLFSYWN